MDYGVFRNGKCFLLSKYRSSKPLLHPIDLFMHEIHSLVVLIKIIQITFRDFERAVSEIELDSYSWSAAVFFALLFPNRELRKKGTPEFRLNELCSNYSQFFVLFTQRLFFKSRKTDRICIEQYTNCMHLLPNKHKLH